jgi:hypothetical protein
MTLVFELAVDMTFELKGFNVVFQEPKGGTITCPDKNYYCFALWTEDEVGNQTIISQGK